MINYPSKRVLCNSGGQDSRKGDSEMYLEYGSGATLAKLRYGIDGKIFGKTMRLRQAALDLKW